MMRFIMVSLLVISLSGLPGLIPLSPAAATDAAPPILYHSPPAPLSLGETVLIRAVVEDESDIRGVTLWYRAIGEKPYRAIPMIKSSENSYEARIMMTEDFKKGIEYYIEASDPFGNQGTDGEKAMPYFAEIRTDAGAEAVKRPWWKSPWFWTGMVLAIGGGIAMTRSGDKKEGSGTVIVQ
jgi:hypothetical protein